MQAVAGAGRTDLWIGGEANFGSDASNVLRFDGGRWSIVPSPLAITNGIWGASEDDVWFVGDDGSFAGEGAIAHWDGVDITVAAAIGGGTLTDVWGASATDIYAVGVDFGPLVEMPARHWDGNAWTPIPGVTGRRVAGSGSNDVWIASFTGTASLRRHELVAGPRAGGRVGHRAGRRRRRARSGWLPFPNPASSSSNISTPPA